MGYAVKLRIATSFLGVAVALALYGLWRIHSEAVRGEISPVSFALLFGGAVVGLAAGISRIYLRIRIKHPKNAEHVGWKPWLQQASNTGKKRHAGTLDL